MHVRASLCAVTTVAMTLATLSARADSLLDRYPHDEWVTLSDGQEMALPLHIQSASGVVLAGLAKLEPLRAYLAPHGLEPLPLTPTQGFVALYNMNYARTDLGPYEELVIVVAATRDHGPRIPILSTVNDYAGLLSIYVPLLRGLIGDRSKDVLFTWKFYVTAELPLRAGREVWGFPKTLADIDVSASAHAASFSIREGGELVVEGSYRRLLPWQLPVSVDSYLMTPLDVQQTVCQGLADTQSRFDFFLPWDELHINVDHPWGAALDAVGFKPVLWHTMTDLESVFLSPLER